LKLVVNLQISKILRGQIIIFQLDGLGGISKNYRSTFNIVWV